MTGIAPRSILRHLLDSAVASAQPDRCVSSFLPDLPKGRTVVGGAGKAAAAMARAVENFFPAPVEGVVVTRYGAAVPCDAIQVLEAAHPIADEASIVAAKSMLAAVEGLTRDDLVLALISGGGSALMSLPVEGVDLAEKQALAGQLMRAGAPIDLLNRVRRRLSQIKGGGLRQAIGAARCVTLAISDVVGDDPALIASGPTIVSRADAGSLLDEMAPYRVTVSPHLRELLASQPSGPSTIPSRQDDEVHIVASPRTALEAAAAEARRLGLTPILLGDDIEGSPAAAARRHLAMWREAALGSVLLSGGELTCEVRGQGRGGPNHEFALELMRAAAPDDALWAIACDTDGCDGNSQVAGAIFGPDSICRARNLGLDIGSFLARNDSAAFFAELGGLVETGPTQTNVNDFRALLKV